MTITPGNWNLTVYKGGTFSYTITWTDQSNTPINLTGYTAKMMVRQSLDSAAAILTLTTENGGITLGGSAGTIALSIDKTTTAALPALIGLYDLEIISPGGGVDFLTQGYVNIRQMVTV